MDSRPDCCTSSKESWRAEVGRAAAPWFLCVMLLLLLEAGAGAADSGVVAAALCLLLLGTLGLVSLALLTADEDDAVLSGLPPSVQERSSALRLRRLVLRVRHAACACLQSVHATILSMLHPLLHSQQQKSDSEE